MLEGGQRADLEVVTEKNQETNTGKIKGEKKGTRGEDI